jgi:hypothetical protein
MLSAAFYYTECHHAECRYAKCRGALNNNIIAFVALPYFLQRFYTINKSELSLPNINSRLQHLLRQA